MPGTPQSIPGAPTAAPALCWSPEQPPSPGAGKVRVGPHHPAKLVEKPGQSLHPARDAAAPEPHTHCWPRGPRGSWWSRGAISPGKADQTLAGKHCERARTTSRSQWGLQGTLPVLPEGPGSPRPAKVSTGCSLYPLSWGTRGARLPIVPSQARLSRCPSDAC